MRFIKTLIAAITAIAVPCLALAQSGTVTSVGVTNGGGLTVSGSPITTSGSITLGVDYTRNNNWTGDQLFGSGRPWCDVRSQGALGNGVADDTTAIMACVNFINTNWGSTGGIVFFPSSPNPYCTFSGINDGPAFPASAAPITFVSAGKQVLETCGNNVATVTLTHPGSVIRDFNIYGYGIGSDTFGAAIHPAILTTTTASYARLENLYAAFGSFPLEVHCSGCTYTGVSAAYAYGDGSGVRNANAYISTSGQYWTNSSLDQVLPFSPGPIYPTTVNNWAPSHVYTQGTVVGADCVSRHWFWQARNSGTSGSTQPNCLNYNIDISDNVTGSCPTPSAGICWQLVGPNPFYAMQADSGVDELIVDSTDFTGFFSQCFVMTHTLGGGLFPPTNVRLHNTTPGGCYLQGFYLSDGNGFKAEGGDFQGCILPGCSGAYIPSTFGGRSSFTGIQWGNGAGYGIATATGITNITISDNFFAVDNAVTLNASNNWITGHGNNCVGSGVGLTGSPGAGGYFPTGTGGNPGC